MFKVETGEGLTDSTSFVTVMAFKTYSADRGRNLTEYGDAHIQAALIRATQYLSESFSWKGRRTRTRYDVAGFQNLAWPRYGAYDREGSWVESQSIPREVQWATHELGYQELTNPHSLQPVYTPHGRVKMEKVGPLAVEYDVSRSDAQGARPVLLAVRDLIGEYLTPGSNNRLSGRSVRA